MREIDNQGKRKTFERAQRIARYLPYWARRLLFRQIHAQLGGDLRLMASAASYLPPSVQQDWESLGIVVAPGLRRDRVRPGGRDIHSRTTQPEPSATPSHPSRSASTTRPAKY